MKKKIVVFVLAALASSLSMSGYAQVNGAEEAASDQEVDFAAQNFRAIEHYARRGLLVSSLAYVDTVFDHGVIGNEQLWGTVSYDQLKNSSLKSTVPSFKLGYTHQVNEDLRLGIGGLLARESNDWSRSLQAPFETKNKIFGLSLYGRYQPNQWFADFIVGGWYARNSYTLPESAEAENDAHHNNLDNPSAGGSDSGSAAGVSGTQPDAGGDAAGAAGGAGGDVSSGGTSDHHDTAGGGNPEGTLAAGSASEEGGAPGAENAGAEGNHDAGAAETQPSMDPAGTSSVEKTVGVENFGDGGVLGDDEEAAPAAASRSRRSLPDENVAEDEDSVEQHRDIGFKKSQRGLFVGIRVGRDYPISESFMVTPSLQGTWGYSSAMFENARSYHATTLGAHLSGDWKVRPSIKLGADFAADYIWTNVDKMFNAENPTLDIFGLEKGLKKDWRWKAGVHANFTPVKRVELVLNAAYQRYQKSKFHGMTFDATVKYHF